MGARILSAALLVLVLGLSLTEAHIRLSCPPTIDADILKNWPCGSGNMDYSRPITTFAPGVNTITIEEFINHNGAPMRVALAFGDQDFSWVLYDHIPHWDSAVSTKYYKFQVNLPDINCTNCALQVVNPMTDKIGGGSCTYSTNGTGSCFSVYHTCSRIAITGTQSVDAWKASYRTSGYQPPAGWTYTDTPNVYNAGEAGNWPGGFLASQNSSTIRGPCASSPSSSTAPFSPVAPVPVGPPKARSAAVKIGATSAFLLLAFVVLVAWM
eukprot:TRINITY_DN12530_c0_g1_i1.p1 TRINITY_DN12530_c0_g1~~TRINITY_DN12530_c0_g1_i1.p1  ORF type:complete len:278 (+),score=47.13 TRINITY_DN12530_c0_g1_i1:31-834(+)